MPRVHGRSPEVFPDVLARFRSVFGDEVAAVMLPDGCWEITAPEAAWLRYLGGAPELRAGLALVIWPRSGSSSGTGNTLR
jgi:hypothetical protein